MKKTIRFQQRKQKKKRMRIIILTLCFVFAVLVFVFLKTFELNTIVIEGNTRYTEQEIKDLLLTKATDHVSLFFYLRMRWQGTSAIPFVEKVEVELTGRHKAVITVHEKLITGCVEHRGNYLYFDRDGIIVESTRERLEGVPVVVGLSFSQIVLHEKLKTQTEGMFDVILNLARLIERNELAVDEIKFSSDDSVMLTAQGCELFLGKRPFYDEVLAVLKSVLAEAKGRKLRIDLTLYENGNGRITAYPLDAKEEEE